MTKQKVCIIGDGLTGLVTATVLSKLNLEIDLVTTNTVKKNLKSIRTLAVSQKNLEFLKKLKINNTLDGKFWPCDLMKLYTANEKTKYSEIFEINRKKKQKKEILYMIENSALINNFYKSIKKNKSIKYVAVKKIHSIINSGLLKSLKTNSKNKSQYNLIVICKEDLSNLIKNKLFNQPYNEVAVTTILKHKSLPNNIARQIFFGSEILALLPISKTKTSIVWTVKKKIIKKNQDNKLFLKNKIKNYTKEFLPQIQFCSDIEFKDLSLSLREKYFDDRVLLFGDILHKVHPLTGQGFNMTLRDLSSLEKILKRKIDLGLDIGTPDILEEFSQEAKPRNFVYSLGIDFLKNFFSLENKSLSNIRNKIITNINKNNLAKNIFYNFANTGFKF